MTFDNQTLVYIAIGAAALLNVPWSQVWTWLSALRVPDFGNPKDDELLIVSLKEVNKSLHCICEAIRELKDKP